MIISLNSIELTPKVLDIAKFLDVKHIGLELPISDLPKEEFGIEFFSRLTIVESERITTNTIKKVLASNRRKYQYIVVVPRRKGVASIVTRDNRVDAVRITDGSSLSVFNKRYSNRLVENDKIVELDITSFFNDKLATNIRPVQRVLDSFEKSNLKYSLNTTVDKPHLLRSYRGLQSIGRILGLSNAQTKKDHVLQRLDRNKKKLKGNIPFQGVEIVDGS